jgi:hypothetical protein
MKMIAICCVLLFVHCYKAKCQSLIIKGKVKCLNQSQNSTKGAENVIIVPAFMPSKATITASQPSGYFEFNTGVPISKLQDKQVTIYVISRCTSCQEVAKRVFISEDQDRQNRNDTKKYVTIKDWMLNTNCQKAELKPFAADSVLRIVARQPDQNLENMSAATSLVGAPALLNLLTTISPVAGVLANAGYFEVSTLDPGKINYGEFLLASPLMHSANTGFNFSPSRDISEAMFWNPSAIAQGRKPHNISLHTNLKNNVKLGGFYSINEKFTLAAGGIYTFQDERRKSFYIPVPSDDPYNNLLEVDSTKMKLQEYAVFLSPVYKVNDNLSVALTLKAIWQDFNIPSLVFVEFSDGVGIGTFSDSTVRKQHFDVDISATLKVTNALQIGANLMNLAGSELYANAFVPGQADVPMQKQRSLGLGIIYKWQRFNFGTDMLFTADGLYDATVGANYVPFNNALLSAGFAVKQLSYSFAFRMKFFRIAYINDNEWLVNERRTGKSEILNGKIYGGFIFDLN